METKLYPVAKTIKNNKRRCKEVICLTRKRWGEEEVKLLLDYLQEQDVFEKPTAQVFYRKFVKSSGIDATWDLCRWKVKHLKNCYLKAESWRNSTGVAIDSTPMVQAKLRNICRFYDELHRIFGPKYSHFSFEVVNSEIKNELEINISPDVKEFKNDNNEFIGFEGINDFRSTPVIEDSEAAVADDDNVEQQSASSASQPTPSPSTSNLPPNFYHKSKAALLNNVEPKSSLDQLYVIQNEKNKYLKLKIEFEKEKFQKEFQLKERQFEEHLKERNENFELKKLEIEKDERLRILEIEKQERIERFEIEMRYKYHSQN